MKLVLPMKLILRKRESISRRAAVLVPMISFVVALLFGAILLAVSGANPWVTYAAMFGGAFGSIYGLSEVLVKTIPLLLTALGVTLAFKMRFWNIGAEGQLTMGAVAATGVTRVICPDGRCCPWRSWRDVWRARCGLAALPS